jgi:hypothetical protein
MHPLSRAQHRAHPVIERLQTLPQGSPARQLLLDHGLSVPVRHEAGLYTPDAVYAFIDGEVLDRDASESLSAWLLELKGDQLESLPLLAEMQRLNPSFTPHLYRDRAAPAWNNAVAHHEAAWMRLIEAATERQLCVVLARFPMSPPLQPIWGKPE